MTKREHWEKIQFAESWLRDHSTHKAVTSALERYERLCNDYFELYGEREYETNWVDGFDFEKARAKLSEKMPALQKPLL